VSEKRRNLLILGLVVVLLAGVAVLKAERGFSLGLDLQGGLEVVLDARPLPHQQVTQQELDQASTILANRIDPNGVLQPEIRSSLNPAQITVSVPGIKNPAAAAALLVSSGQLQNFDLFKYLDKASQGTSLYTAAPSSSVYDLLTKVQPQITTKNPATSWALFDKNHHQLGQV